MDNIKRFLETHCLGYSHDFKQTYYVHVVELESGERVVRYSTDVETSYGREQGRLVKSRPNVAVPVSLW